MSTETLDTNPFLDLIKDINQPLVDEVVFKWHIPSFTEIKKSEKVHSPEFQCADHTWYPILI